MAAGVIPPEKFTFTHCEFFPDPLDLVRHRGLEPVSSDPVDRVFVPEASSPEEENELDRLWADYGFRIFLRDLLRHADHATPENTARFVSPDAARRFLEVLKQVRLVEHMGDGVYRCRVSGDGVFGVSLERYTARLLQKDFGIPSRYAVRIRLAGPGDYDVLGALGSRLIYVEVKGAPPKHIQQNEIQAFWERLCTLQPDLAVYLVDTHLRMKDKLVPMFTEALQSFRLKEFPNAGIERLENEIFHMEKRVFITNSRRSLRENFRKILKAVTVHRFERGESPE